METASTILIFEGAQTSSLKKRLDLATASSVSRSDGTNIETRDRII